MAGSETAVAETETRVLLAKASVYFAGTRVFFIETAVFLGETAVAEVATMVFLGETTVAVNATAGLFVARQGFNHGVHGEHGGGQDLQRQFGISVSEGCSCSRLVLLSIASIGRWVGF